MITLPDSPIAFQSIDDKQFVDVPASVPAVKLTLPKVGVTRRPHYIQVRDPFTNVSARMWSDINVFFTLPRNQRGVHMSRIEDCLQAISEQKDLCLSEWIECLSEQLLRSQQLEQCMVDVTTHCEKDTDRNQSGRTSCEIINLHTRIERSLEEKRLWSGVTVPFINACPCTQRWAMREFYRHLIDAGYDRKSAEELVKRAPLQAHTNGGSASLIIGSDQVNHKEIYDLLDGTLPIVRELLKGQDEHSLVSHAHQDGQFCEDNIRSIVAAVVDRFDGKIEDTASIEVVVEVNESVHFHNLHSAISGSLGSFKDQLGK